MKALESSKPQNNTLVNRIMHTLLHVGSQRFNPFILKYGGSRRLPMISVIQHKGRRSGRSFSTPLAARPTANGFVIPLTFGEQADWIRNVQAAGGCTIRWKGTTYTVIEPEIVDWAEVRASFYPAERVLVPLIGIRRFVRLRHTPASASNPI